MFLTNNPEDLFVIIIKQTQSDKKRVLNIDIKLYELGTVVQETEMRNTSLE